MMTAEQLKGSILQLAIQGKLVEQRSEEGTGKELLSKIKKSKTDGNRNASFEEDPPFDIPESWEWVKHNFLFQISGGSQPPKSKFYSEMKKGFVRLYQIRDYGDKPIPVFVDKKLVSKFTHKGDILLARYGGSLGKVFWAEEGAYNVAMAKVIPLFNESLVAKEFIFLYYHSSLYQSVVLNASRSAQAGFNKNDLDSMFFPIPPLAEQKRIVAKIEELMPFVEQYAAASTKLNTLNTTFPDMIKKSILQEAVQGKLVPQDPNDEPASVLLKKIAEEKKRLIKEGKIKKQKPLPAITEDEIPFDIPESWEWARLENTADMLSGFAFKSSDFVQGGKYRLLRGINLGVGEVRWDDTVFINNTSDKLLIYQLKKGDVLLGLDRPWISNGIRVAVFDGLENTYLVQRVLRIREIGVLTCEYIALILRSSLLSVAVQGQTTGISVPHISPKQVGGIAIPVPPIEEQKRIVEKVKQLCTEIEMMRKK